MTRPNFYQKSFGVATHLWHFRWGQTRNRKTLCNVYPCTLQDRYKFIFVVCRLTKFTDLKGWGCKVPQEVLKKLLVGLQVRPWYNQFLQAGEVDGIMIWTHKSEMVVNGDGMFLHIMTNSHWLFQYFKKSNLSTCRCLLRQNLRRTQPSDSALAWMRRLDLPTTHFHPKVR